MKKGSNLSMFKSQWDETKAKWGRWDLETEVLNWEIHPILLQIFQSESKIRQLFKEWVLSGHWWRPTPTELITFFFELVEK